VNGPATRSRWIELRRSREAARRGRELLDEKREALLREILKRRDRFAEKRRSAEKRLARARALLAEAGIELGLDAVDAAALAQRQDVGVELAPKRVAGIAARSARLVRQPFRVRYGLHGTAGSLDRAAEAFAELLPDLVEIAEDEDLVTRLESALRKTNRRLNALDKVILPALEADLNRIASALEEEERDESIRRKLRSVRSRSRAPDAMTATK
jgi:V/A-type H+-transporting ATPase subunit D